MSWVSTIYSGKVVHRRHRPTAHHLSYRVFALYLDLDELPCLSERLRLFSYNRAGVFSFHDTDHGNGVPGGLRHWVDAQIEKAGLDARTMRVGLLCYPRMFGYVFNPLSVYFCRDEEGNVRLILYEVCNTFGERHTYVIPVENMAPKGIRHACDKALYVSPFLSMKCRYNFRILPPTEDVLVAINETEEDAPVLHASFAGQRRDLTDRALLGLLLSHPLMTLKITGAIHLEAARLWLKKIPFHRHTPSPHRVTQTLVKPDQKADPHESY
ncbi:DUF1365 domain-containing protein [Nitratireductor sp.]|uniref:DUF1365 domain-containing protein n=1 Tax=Nitratireductor sp. TaxID=1872084 RepID=UPI0025CB7F72|nr:DUF1365 family protein [Nitratireductor sp.]